MNIKKFIVLIYCILISFFINGQINDSLMKIHLDIPIVLKQQIVQNINILSAYKDTLTADIHIQLFNNRKELLFTTVTKQNISAAQTVYDLEWKKSGFKKHAFYDLFLNYAILPMADSLYFEVAVIYNQDTAQYKQIVKDDSSFLHQSILIKDFVYKYEHSNKLKAGFLGYKKFAKSYFEDKGFSISIQSESDLHKISIVHKAGNIGNYFHAKNNTQNSKHNIHFNLDQTTFQTSAQKESIDKEKKDRKIEGTVYVQSQLSNGKEPDAAIDNNYYELGGSVQIPVMGIPVMINGMYTSQDKGRKFKASYINFSFDKSKLTEQLDQYKSIYEENSEKFKDIKHNTVSNFNTNLSNTENYKSKIISEVKNEISILIYKLADSSNLLNGTNKATYDRLVNVYQDPASINAADIEDLKCEKCDTAVNQKITKIVKILRDVNKYTALYNDIKNKYEDINVKQLVDSHQIEDYTKKYYDGDKSITENMPDLIEKLPNGKIKKWVTKFTNIDMGMLSNYHSDYTLAGQMNKGLDIGYDFDLFKAGLNIGNTDYLSADGTVIKYRTGLAKVSFEPLKNNELQLSYFTYVPANNQELLPQGTIKDSIGGILSSLDNRTAIYSLLYYGKFDKADIKIDFSNSQSAQQKFNIADLNNSSFNVLLATHLLPNNDLGIAFEHIGHQFENKVLPFLFSGTQKIKISNTGTYFKNRIMLTLEYQLLTQVAESYVGKNRKLGVQLQTKFKNKPNVSLAYKPFTTFRTVTDTHRIQQRPMMGDVFLFRSNYAFKSNHGASYNFNLILNYNTSLIDTATYINYNTQLLAGYRNKGLNIQTTFGYINSSGVAYETSVGNSNMLFNNIFESIQANVQLNQLLTMGGGFELAHYKDVIVRMGLNANASVNLLRWPLRFTLMTRWMNYNKNIAPENASFGAFNLGVFYTFTTKKDDNK